MAFRVPRRLDGLVPGIARRQRLAAGLVDSALASLATLAVGVFAVRALTPTELGAYALAYQVVFLVGIIPMSTVFLPAEAAVVSHEARRRISCLRRSLPWGAIPATLASGAVPLWVVGAPADVPSDAILGLSITSIAVAILSPAQDHVRRLLHSADSSWVSAMMSAVQLSVVIGSLTVLSRLDVPGVWIPFGALAIANLVSFSAGATWALTRSVPALDAGTLPIGELLSAGRWLLGGALISPAATFLTAVAVSRLAGIDSLGHAEAARVAAQPVWVVAVGLSSVLGPRSMTAARRHDRELARRAALTHGKGVGIAGFAVIALFGWIWPGNVVAWLLPAAYVVPGLMLATVVGQVLHGLAFPYRSELLGARLESRLTRCEVPANIARLAVAVTARWTAAFAIPLGLVALGMVRLVGFRRALRSVYAEGVSGARPAGP